VLEKELGTLCVRNSSKGPDEMIGFDRPVGSLVDELALPDNWRTFKARGKSVDPGHS